jgi:dTDP-4-amino-4,6-dideoxygalactose transaminase
MPADGFIPLTRPWMDEREVEAVRRPIGSGWITQGPEVAAFEREFAAFVGAPFACAVSSGTASLHLALLAVGVRPGDEVVTVSHSFIATANAVRYCGATPVFVDIVPETFNIDPARIDSVVTASTRAILCVHQVGMPCDLAGVLAVARRHGLPLVEDAACAVGSEILWGGRWERIGRPHGTVACFSFHPRKLISTGDGGMVTTAEPELDRRFRLWRQHGMSVPAADRHLASEVTFENYLLLGYNYRMTDVHAAMGREQLARLPALVARRRDQAARYHERLASVPSLGIPEESTWARSNWQTYVVRLPAGCDQRRVMQRMLNAKIATRRAVMCAHREPAYPPGTWSCGVDRRLCGCLPPTCARLRHSEAAQDGAIALPLFHQMTEVDQDRVVASLRAAIEA